MRWAVAFLLLALLVPVAAVLYEAFIGRRRREAAPLQPSTAPLPPNDVEQRLRAIEDDVSDLGREIAELRDELEGVQRQLEGRRAAPASDGRAGDR